MVEVLILDDSKFMRTILRKMLESDPEIRVVGEAVDGVSALEFIKQKSPEVVTLDLQVPIKDSLSVLSRILKEKPTTRVIVISASTKDGAEASAEALKKGAVGMVQKPSGTSSAEIEKTRIELINTIKAAVKANPPQEVKGTDDALAKKVDLKESSAEPAKKIVVICASTGGPLEIRKVVSMLNGKMPAAVIVLQQIHSKFTRILMKDLPSKLKETTSLTVKIANDDDVLRNGEIAFAPEENDIVVTLESGCFTIRKQPQTGQGGPSFDVMLKSVANVCGKDSIGVILTGDTNDGIAGVAAMKAAGGKVIVQDPSWGCASPQMAKAVIKSIDVDYVLKLEDIAVKILELLGGGGKIG